MLIAGVDEVGRGCLAGPVFAAAVILKKPIEGLCDSKKLSPERRQILSKDIKLNSFYAFGMATPSEIDKINILQASLLAMKRAILSLHVKPIKILVDGIYKPDINFDIKAIIKGDSYIDEISAASIIAKVERDNYMIKIDDKYPGYGFKNHKGYGTKMHLEKLNLMGATDIHRKTFKGVIV